LGEYVRWHQSLQVGKNLTFDFNKKVSKSEWKSAAFLKGLWFLTKQTSGKGSSGPPALASPWGALGGGKRNETENETNILRPPASRRKPDVEHPQTRRAYASTLAGGSLAAQSSTIKPRINFIAGSGTNGKVERFLREE